MTMSEFVSRCRITGNPVGTDTVFKDAECCCEPCQINALKLRNRALEQHLKNMLHAYDSTTLAIVDSIKVDEAREAVKED